MEELENEISTQAEENTVSLASAQALADALTKIEAYTPTTWVDNSSPDIDAEHLNKPEQAIKRVTDALNSAVDVIKDLQSQVTKNSGAISDVNNNLSNTNSRLDTSLSSSVLDYALTLPEGMHTVRFPGDGYTGTDLPNSSYMYSSATISVRSTGKIATVLLFGISKNCPLAVNSCENGKWKGWDQYVTKDDLPIIGKFTNKKNKDIIKIGSVVKSRSVVCVFPRYNTLTTVRCIYPSLEISAGEDQFQLFAWDTNTQNDSTSTNLEGYYIVMPMLSK